MKINKICIYICVHLFLYFPRVFSLFSIRIGPGGNQWIPIDYLFFLSFFFCFWFVSDTNRLGRKSTNTNWIFVFIFLFFVSCISLFLIRIGRGGTELAYLACLKDSNRCFEFSRFKIFNFQFSTFQFFNFSIFQLFNFSIFQFLKIFQFSIFQFFNFSIFQFFNFQFQF